MESKAFRIDWYPRDSFMDFCTLQAEEIGVLMQVVNLIYSYNGAVMNDPKHIGKSCGITQKKCERIIHRLILKGHLFEIKPGLLHKNRCIFELKALEKRRKNNSKNGENGADARWGKQRNQRDKNGSAIPVEIASTSTNQSPSKNTYTNTICGSARQGGEDLLRFGQKASPSPNRNKNFDIEPYLSDKDRRLAKEAAPGWDQQELMRTYNEWHNGEEGKPIPDKPARAYVAWCASFTKGKKP